MYAATSLTSGGRGRSVQCAPSSDVTWIRPSSVPTHKCPFVSGDSAIVKIGVTKTGYYVVDVWRHKVEFPGLLHRVRALGDELLPPTAIYVEDTSNATALIQALKAETRLPIVPVTAKGSKESRVEGITGTVEAKRVFLPEEAPWLLDFERELLSFPGGRHDDQGGFG